MSAFGGKADMTVASQNVRLRPKAAARVPLINALIYINGVSRGRSSFLY